MVVLATTLGKGVMKDINLSKLLSEYFDLYHSEECFNYHTDFKKKIKFIYNPY